MYWVKEFLDWQMIALCMFRIRAWSTGLQRYCTCMYIFFTSLRIGKDCKKKRLDRVRTDRSEEIHYITYARWHVEVAEMFKEWAPWSLDEVCQTSTYSTGACPASSCTCLIRRPDTVYKDATPTSLSFPPTCNNIM